MAERDEDGRLITYRGMGDSPNCGDCPCARAGKPIKPVRAYGSTGSLMVVGEGPGAEEVFQGYPFIGPSGRIVTTVFQRHKADRQLMWITNALLCARPKDDNDFVRAVECCRPRLAEEVAMVQPTAILALGGTAVRALKLPVVTILEARGTVQDSPLAPGVPVITSIHPAALLKGGAGETGGGKQKMNVDAQHQFLEADIIKAWRVARGEIAPSWSDDIEVFVEPDVDTAAVAAAVDDGKIDGYDRAFLAWQSEHPEVYMALVSTAREAIELGVPAAMFWPAACFEVKRSHKLDVPNAYRTQFQRFIPSQEPDLAAFFGGLR